MAARSRLCVSVLALVLVSPATPVLAQDRGIPWPVESYPGFCRGWGELIPPPDGSRIPTCAAASLTGEELAARFPDLPLPPVIRDQQLIHFIDDPVGDQFLLEDGTSPRSADPATDYLGAYWARIESDTEQARRMRDWWTSVDEAGAVVTSAQPPAKLFKPGSWIWTFLPTADSPLDAPDQTRVYQVAFMGPPGRSVPAVIPLTSAIDGARHVWHYRQDPAGKRRITHSVQQSDFGGEPGPSGSHYYNADPLVIVVVTPQGVQAFARGALDPLGAFRVSGWDSNSWDIVSAPESPMAYIPTDEDVPALIEAWALGLAHEEIPDQDLILDQVPQEGVTLASYHLYPVSSPVLADLSSVPPLDFDLDFEGRDLVFNEIQAILSEAPYIPLYTHGLVGYGTYCIDDVSFSGLDEITWSDGTPLTPEDVGYFEHAGEAARRVLGTSCVRVDEAEGLLHQSAWTAWKWDPEGATRILGLYEDFKTGR